jgi:hypothetical protein
MDFIDSLAKKSINSGGKIYPLIIDSELNNGLGLMNPSIFLDENKTILNLRAVNYTFYHSEEKLFQHQYGPLTYVHPENDIHLRTWNYYLELDENYKISRVNKIDTSKFPEKELWDFVGLEDARIFRWEGRLYTSGVRRDLDPTGIGRMELCEIEVLEDKVVELSRFRIPPPIDKNSYCEKNWMPILDLPYHYVKWSNPTEIVKVDPIKETCEQIFCGQHKNIQRDLRGGTQVISWKNYYLAVTHEVDLFQSEVDRKDAVYRHRIVLWDKDWNLVKWSKDFSIMGGHVEFCVGLAYRNKEFLLTFGFQDNAAYLLTVPESVIEEFLND